MANVKKGLTVSAPEWWKHLKWCKRVFWKKQRKAFARDNQERVKEREHEREGPSKVFRSSD